MSLFVFLIVLFSALLHAGWNALIKLGTSQLTSMLILTLTQGGMGLAIAATQPLPEGQVWLWLVASGILHAGYKIFLALAYEQGDLSRVYPIARGASPLIVLAASGLLLSDVISGTEVTGIIVLGAGILWMAHGVFASKEALRLIPLALGSAIATAGYSLVDGLGARVSGDVVAYVAWLFVFDLTFFLPTALLLRGRDVVRAPRKAWFSGAIAAALSYGAYAISVWAMTKAPVALVAALRETSILFAVLIGWSLFGDKMDRGKIASVLLIACGVILMRV
ncbi:MAG: EamA family transporter [Marinosulfonomonas sp.]